MSFASSTNIQNESYGIARLTTSWRDLGDGDSIDHRVLDSYEERLTEIDNSGLRPCIALRADDLPDDLADAGGWRLRETAARYASYTGAIAARFGDWVDHWVTMSAPLATLDQHFRLDGKSLTEAASVGMLDASHNLLLAHGGATQVIRAHVPKAEIGIDLDVDLLIPADDTDRTITGGWTNQWFPHALATGEYPQAVVDAFGWDQAAVQPGDHAIITRRIDFICVRASERAGEMIGRLSTQHGFERFWVVADGEPADTAVGAASNGTAEAPLTSIVTEHIVGV